jgi:hypothetical protein
MSTPPDRPQLPEHLRPLTVAIPRTWTPEEALAVFELIDGGDTPPNHRPA